MHLFAALVHKDVTVVAQRQVDSKSNEITSFRPLLESLDLEGKVVTADAGGFFPLPTFNAKRDTGGLKPVPFRLVGL